LVSFSGDAGAQSSNVGVDFDNFPLPITLLKFTASPFNREVILEWSTSSEINNDFFTIERSLHLKNWETISNIKGAGNSNFIKYYNSSDKTPYQGVSYYRLKQTDFNGTTSYSSIESVLIGESIEDVSIFPNPTSDMITIVGNDNNLKRIIIYNYLMQEVAIINNPENKGIVKISLSAYKNGCYFVKIKNNGYKVCKQ
jgi:hypothetical protein